MPIVCSAVPRSLVFSLALASVLSSAPLLATGVALSGAPSATTNAVDLPEEVTFTEHVAPIFMANCIHCHRPGDVAPMSLLSYTEARPWAKSIQRAVTARDMPPWDANPEYGTFANDVSLSDQEIALIHKWVTQGAPEGDPAHMPPVPQLPPAGSWKMGTEPDYVIDLAAVNVPADGPDLFTTQLYGMEIPEGKWVRAIELLPGNTDVLHHVVVYLGPFGMSDEGEEGNAGANQVIYLNDAAQRRIRMTEAPRVGGVWVAGSPPTRFAEGTGHPLAADQIISLNMHYHPSGNAGSDASKVGFYFGEGELDKEITTAFAADPGIFIPAGVADHREDAYYLFAQDSTILSFMPHLHQRGKSMRYTLYRPDGSSEILLDVPAYDYDWQNIYYPAVPISVAAGSLIDVEAHWDNSEGNEANPDATVDVPWGDGTNNEMLVAFLDFVVDEGKKPRGVRVNSQIEKLLARHQGERRYMVAVDGMGFGGNWGLTLPAEGEGRFYMWFGSLMFSASIREVHETSDGELLFNGAMITSGGGTRAPLGFAARIEEDGTLSGELFFGREISADNLEELRGSGRSFTGTPPPEVSTEPAPAAP